MDKFDKAAQYIKNEIDKCLIFKSDDKDIYNKDIFYISDKQFIREKKLKRLLNNSDDISIFKPTTNSKVFFHVDYLTKFLFFEYEIRNNLYKFNLNDIEIYFIFKKLMKKYDNFKELEKIEPFSFDMEKYFNNYHNNFEILTDNGLLEIKNNAAIQYKIYLETIHV